MAMVDSRGAPYTSVEIRVPALVKPISFGEERSVVEYTAGLIEYFVDGTPVHEAEFLERFPEYSKK